MKTNCHHGIKTSVTFKKHISRNYTLFQITKGPTQNEFGCNEFPLITNNFLSKPLTLLLVISRTQCKFHAVFIDSLNFILSNKYKWITVLLFREGQYASSPTMFSDEYVSSFIRLISCEGTQNLNSQYYFKIEYPLEMNYFRK